MIVKLTGHLDEINENTVTVDVNGVGYCVYISKKNIQRLPEIGQKIVLFVSHIIRQDDQMLCGFLTREDREWFECLITVQGVGAKVALSILSFLTSADLTHAILGQDPTPLKQAEGVGAKVANRIILELKNKIPASENLNQQLSTPPGSLYAFEDAILALCQLGYKKQEITPIVKTIIEENADIKEADLIRKTLQKLSKH